ncbi:hypothetical protein [Brumimicrobium sp.]|uniref:hypothetical protein n=1 Tax=Brumimicrobium sp. TaxID=2029867 RepID=UPI003A923589
MENLIYMKGWKNPVTGFFLEKKTVFSLSIYNPVDYVLDGVMFMNNSFVLSAEMNLSELSSNVMSEKINRYVNQEKIKTILETSNFKELFSYLLKKDDFCEIALSQEDTVYIGRVRKVRNSSIDIDFYNTDFTLLDEAIIEFDDIRIVSVYTDYSETFCEFIKSINN